MVKIKKFVAPTGAAAIAFAMIIGTAASASATNNIKPFGVQETLKEAGGAVEIGYTVDGLSPSTDMVPYPVNGQLYEARVTVDGVAGWVNPVIANFNARALSGDNYRVLTVVTPDGLSPAPVPPGGQSSGKLYFDVVGDVPNSVVYNDGFTDLLAWVDVSGR